MLVFVGEDLDVVVIASRREESARKAPAVAGVVSRSDFLKEGGSTLAHILDRQPGFYMAEKEGGVQPFLRGIPDSMLLLYDTVPQGSDLSKRFYPLGNELSLAGIKRVEVMRGPGSVLWGPDAFAGIVNVVPMTGKDLNGVETGILHASPGDHAGAYLNAGTDQGLWQGFISMSGRRGREDERSVDLIRFWGGGAENPVPPEQRFGHADPEAAEYLQADANFSYRDHLKISAHLSDFNRPYGISDLGAENTWHESQGGNNGFIHAATQKKMGYDFKLTLSGYLSWLKCRNEILDRTLEPSENTTYGEVLIDHSLWSGRGLFTSGISYRDRRVKNAPIWDSFLPAYLGSENESFLPQLTQEDYNTRLLSVFGQYTHKIGEVDIWCGLRNDDHDSYQDHLSFTSGIGWNPTHAWVFKLLYGTAYRTPFARQLFNDGVPELENIESWNLQAGFRPVEKAEFTLTGFTSRVGDHTREDAYAGLSIPNEQTLNGIELDGRVQVLGNLTLSADWTLMNNAGPLEKYRYNDYTIINPDGSPLRHYVDILYPFVTGPRTFGNIQMIFKPRDDFSARIRMRHCGSQEFTFPTDNTLFSVPPFSRFDLGFTVENCVYPDLNLDLNAANVFDRKYELPGTYSLIKTEGLRIEIGLRKKW